MEDASKSAPTTGFAVCSDITGDDFSLKNVDAPVKVQRAWEREPKQAFAPRLRKGTVWKRRGLRTRSGNPQIQESGLSGPGREGQENRMLPNATDLSRVVKKRCLGMDEEEQPLVIKKTRTMHIGTQWEDRLDAATPKRKRAARDVLLFKPKTPVKEDSIKEDEMVQEEQENLAEEEDDDLILWELSDLAESKGQGEDSVSAETINSAKAIESSEHMELEKSFKEVGTKEAVMVTAEDTDPVHAIELAKAGEETTKVSEPGDSIQSEDAKNSEVAEAMETAEATDPTLAMESVKAFEEEKKDIEPETSIESEDAKDIELAENMEMAEATDPAQATESMKAFEEEIEPEISIESEHATEMGESIELAEAINTADTIHSAEAAEPEKGIDMVDAVQPASTIELAKVIAPVDVFEPTKELENMAESVEPADGIKPVEDIKLVEDIKEGEAIEDSREPKSAIIELVDATESAIIIEPSKATETAVQAIEPEKVIESVETNEPEKTIETTLTSTYIPDDTDLLKSFLDRAQARKAAKLAGEDSDTVRKALAASPSPSLSPPPSPLTNPFESFDRNSPSRTKIGDDDEEANNERETDSQTANQNAEESPVPARRLRSGRSSSRLPALSKTPPPGPNHIPLRRPGGSEAVKLTHGTEAQRLAAQTRANTKKNKGKSTPAVITLKTIAKIAESDVKGDGGLAEEKADSKGSEDVGMKDGEKTDSKKKAVCWDEQLEHFFQEKVEEKDKVAINKDVTKGEEATEKSTRKEKASRSATPKKVVRKEPEQPSPKPCNEELLYTRVVVSPRHLPTSYRNGKLDPKAIPPAPQIIRCVRVIQPLKEGKNGTPAPKKRTRTDDTIAVAADMKMSVKETATKLAKESTKEAKRPVRETAREVIWKGTAREGVKASAVKESARKTATKESTKEQEQPSRQHLKRPLSVSHTVPSQSSSADSSDSPPPRAKKMKPSSVSNEKTAAAPATKPKPKALPRPTTRASKIARLPAAAHGSGTTAGTAIAIPTPALPTTTPVLPTGAAAERPKRRGRPARRT
ncbi:MAG: hypothetical protein M1819_005544 [Sarea resinae]|nr:MAG: hypothetical protein M1819_005544 [Sarea resinae]